MDHRFKYQKIPPVKFDLLAEAKNKTNRDSLLFEEKLSGMAMSRRHMHDNQMVRLHLRIWMEALRKEQEIQTRLDDELRKLYQSTELNTQQPNCVEKTLMQFASDLSQQRDSFFEKIINPINSVR